MAGLSCQKRAYGCLRHLTARPSAYQSRWAFFAVDHYGFPAQPDVHTAIAELATLVSQFAPLLAKRSVIDLGGTTAHAFAIGIDDTVRQPFVHSMTTLERSDSSPLYRGPKNSLFRTAFAAARSSIASASSRSSFAFSLLSSRNRRALDTWSPPCFVFQLQIVAFDKPCCADKPAVFAPVSTSFNTLMISPSVNLVPFMRSVVISGPDSYRDRREIRGPCQVT